jgi:hypothetical protein
MKLILNNFILFNLFNFYLNLNLNFLSESEQGLIFLKKELALFLWKSSVVFFYAINGQTTNIFVISKWTLKKKND